MTATEYKQQKAPWLAGASALLSIAVCYGTLGLIAVLSLMGVTLAVNDHIWAGAIVAFALLAVFGVALGAMKHRKVSPAFLALAGAGLVIWAMYGAEGIADLLELPSFVVELAGFSALVAAALWDWRLKR